MTLEPTMIVAAAHARIGRLRTIATVTMAAPISATDEMSIVRRMSSASLICCGLSVLRPLNAASSRSWPRSVLVKTR